MKKKINEVANKLFFTMCMGATTLVSATSVSFADELGDVAEKASGGILGSGTAMLKPILAIVLLIAGISLLIGGQRAKEETKEKAPQIAAAVALVLFATLFSSTIIGWFE